MDDGVDEEELEGRTGVEEEVEVEEDHWVDEDEVATGTPARCDATKMICSHNAHVAMAFTEAKL